MIVSRAKSSDAILEALMGAETVLIAGCSLCAAACRTGGEPEIAAAADALAAAGKKVTGTLLLEEGCHNTLTARNLRTRKTELEQADAVLVLACGAGVQGVAEATAKRVVAGVDTLFLGNVRRLGSFERRCSMCGDCLLSATGGICPVTSCRKSQLNGPCGGMDGGKCETDLDRDCVWARILSSGRADLSRLLNISQPRDFTRCASTGWECGR